MTCQIAKQNAKQIKRDDTWTNIQRTAGNEDGKARLNSTTVIAIITLLKHAELTQPLGGWVPGQEAEEICINNESYMEYDIDDVDYENNCYIYSSCRIHTGDVEDFTPSLLATDVQQQIRDLLAADSQVAKKLFDDLIALEQRVNFQFDIHAPSHTYIQGQLAPDYELRYEIEVRINAEIEAYHIEALALDEEIKAAAIKDAAYQRSIAGKLNALFARLTGKQLPGKLGLSRPSTPRHA